VCLLAITDQDKFVIRQNAQMGWKDSPGEYGAKETVRFRIEC
jgi:hypothetical protein